MEIFGYPREELIGADTRKLHVDDETFQLFGEESKEAVAESGVYRGTFRMRRQDGTEIPTRHVVTLLHPEEGVESEVVSVVRDMTEEEEARQTLEVYARRLESLQELDRSILEATSEEDLLRRASERIRKLLSAWRVSIVLFSEEETGPDGGKTDDLEVHLMAASMEGRPRGPETGSRIDLPAPAFATVRGGRVKRVPAVDPEEGELLSRGPELVAEGLRSYFSVPIRADDHVVGALNIAYDRPKGFSEIAVELGQEMAAHLGLALRQTRLLSEVRRATRERDEAVRRVERLQVRLEELLDTLELGVARIAEDGTILDVNDAFARILGYGSPAEVESRKAPSLLAHPEEWSDVVDRLQGEGASFQDREYAVVRADGSTIWVSSSGRRVEQADGRRIIEGVIRDVTERKELEEKLLAIGMEERRRIGRELHDQLGQQLTGIAFLARTLADDGESPEEAAHEIEEEARDAITRIRHLARGLDPAELDDQGLADALSELAEESQRLFDVEMDVSVDPDMPLGPGESLPLYRIAQEAVTNAVRHGGATRVRIRVEGTDGGRLFEIQDDGGGFGDATGRDEGMGLRSIRHRCGSLGGELEIAASPWGGAAIRCHLPPEPVSPPTGRGIP